ncbi:hypothetical protein pEaSNUABM28_00120 [Erwinia phage pEa_SNUABM_28]|nr:hypothetical protein pEaSNUABM28_00120 [Erwinia phage pEa_SNUABM_28]
MLNADIGTADTFQARRLAKRKLNAMATLKGTSVPQQTLPDVHRLSPCVHWEAMTPRDSFMTIHQLPLWPSHDEERRANTSSSGRLNVLASR